VPAPDARAREITDRSGGVAPNQALASSVRIAIFIMSPTFSPENSRLFLIWSSLRPRSRRRL
jgi:hypothetical protein